ALLGVLDEDVEVAVVREGAGVEQLVLEILAGAAAGGLDEIAVGELALGVLVQVLHVRVGRRAIEIKVVFLAVLAVVPLAVGKAVEALLEDGIALVPQGQGEAEQLAVVADSAESVLAPLVGAGAGRIVGEVVPGVAVLAVVLADSAPLSLAQIGAPLLPGDAGFPGVVEALLFGDVDN